IVPGFWGKMYHTEGMTFSHWTIEADAELPEHRHPHEQLSYLLEGVLEFTIEGMTKVIVPGKLVVVPPNAPHSVKAVTDCVVIDIFHPVREDYK
ncbi:MAG: cupin domain-containing protein, partial [Sinomicrobium sp.]|nr:cupin domain-containing protein [Sinomicrobium sp.]